MHLSYGGLGGYVIELGNPSVFVSTAAATDAALRIASDIIGSTLAHADELTRSNSNTLLTNSSPSNAYSQSMLNNPDDSSSLMSSSGELSLNDLTLNSHPSHLTASSTPMTATTALTTIAASTSGGSGSGSSSVGNATVNLPRERGSRELLGAAEDLLGATQRVIATADQPTIDLFQQTLIDFHALRLRNIVDSSDEDNEHEQRVTQTQAQSRTQQQQNRHSNSSTPPGQRSSSTHTYNQENNP